MLQLKGLGKAFRGEWLFRSADFHVNERDRIGLVGDNGTGKTTLLKMLAGLCPADEGTVSGPRDLSFGYLPQDGLYVHGRTVFQEALSVFEEIRRMEEECRALEHELAELKEGEAGHDAKLERYSVVSQEFRLKGGYNIDAKTGAVLLGLGFGRTDWDRPCEEFSGGWQMRIVLAKLLLQQPGLLLLDEPTNHLDLEARNWLEDYLQNYPHALILVSHDRYFLDAVVRRIVEIRNRSLHFYVGHYGDYLRQREERIAQLVAAREAQQKQIAHIKAFADKFRYKATKAAQVQSRLKELERMEKIEIPEEAKPMRLRFPEGPRTGRMVLELGHATAGYGAEPVFRDLNLVLERGDKVALVGPNGAGKSTLMKILAGRLPLIEGERREGHKVVVSYFSQDQDDLLASQRTVWEEVYSVAPAYIVPELRTLLGCFLFSGDAVEKPVSVLSGGERSRLVLCKLLLSPANCLLLDEPTNHLDIRSKDILMGSLRGYGGTMVFVSHDRFFLDGLATKVLEVGGGTAVAYLGNYEDYLARKTAEAAGGVSAGEPEVEEGRRAEAAPRERLRRKVNPYKIQEIAARIAEVESVIQTHETRIAVLARMLSTEELYRDYALFRETMDEHEKLRSELEAHMAEWERLQSEISRLQS
jgi:ATP-binding cassette subfamily F protein 3